MSGKLLMQCKQRAPVTKNKNKVRQEHKSLHSSFSLPDWLIADCWFDWFIHSFIHSFFIHWFVLMDGLHGIWSFIFVPSPDTRNIDVSHYFSPTWPRPFECIYLLHYSRDKERVKQQTTEAISLNANLKLREKKQRYFLKSHNNSS